MHIPTVSVITATLDSMPHLRDCLDSVAKQEGISLEHIVIDGGSSDESLQFLQSRNCEWLRWISESDTGIADAMNKGISMAQGEWVYFLQSDDVLARPDSLKSLLNHQRGARIVSGNVLFRPLQAPTRLIKSKGWSMKTAFKTTTPHQGALIQQSLFEELGTYDKGFRVAMDYEWFLRAYWKEISLSHCDIVVAEMQGSGISSRLDWDSLANRFLEERKIHFKHAPSILWRMVYQMYWTVYPAYRRLRFAVS